MLGGGGGAGAMWGLVVGGGGAGAARDTGGGAEARCNRSATSTYTTHHNTDEGWMDIPTQYNMDVGC